MKNSSIPGFSMTTCWPRAGVTESSPASSRAPSPEQLTISRGLVGEVAQRGDAPQSHPPTSGRQPRGEVVQVGHRVDERQRRPVADRKPRRQRRPLADRKPRRQLARLAGCDVPWRCGHRLSGGQAPTAHHHPGIRLSRDRGEVLDRRLLPATAWEPGGAIAGPIIAAAVAEVVCAGSSSLRTSTRNARSATQTAVLSPITPAPTTIASGCQVTGSALQIGATPARVAGHEAVYGHCAAPARGSPLQAIIVTFSLRNVIV